MHPNASKAFKKVHNCELTVKMKLMWRLLCSRRRLRKATTSLCGRLVKITVALVFVYLFVVLFGKLVFHRQTFFRDLNYYIRPIYGSPHRKGPAKRLPHFYSELVPPRNRCHLHGWKPREEGKVPKVVDVVIFSVEFDIYEIRLRELWNVVDAFVIVEASTTFTGTPKRLYFYENRKRFEWAADKIIYYQVTSLSENPSGTYENEDNMRDIVTKFVLSMNLSNGDLVIGSDVDEIPNARTIALVKSCQGYSRELHLEADEYFYSFEFPTGTTTWRPHVTQYDPQTFRYHHEISNDTTELLADGGWHCSFCFRYLSDFVFKMTSYSHAGNMISESSYLDLEEIQRRICEGVDLFELPPEAYTFRDFISRWGPMRRKYGTAGIPASLVESIDRYKWLLPGGCVREDYQHEQSK